MAQKLLVITGGGSRHSNSAMLGEKLREATLHALGEAADAVTHQTFHLGNFAYDMADFLSDGFPGDELAALLEAIRSADGIIAVTPVFKASYSGLFKLFWDITDDGDIANTPTLIAAVGGTGRHSLMLDHALLPLFGFLDADVVARGVYATPEELNGSDACAQKIQHRIKKAGQELAQKMQVERYSL